MSYRLTKAQYFYEQPKQQFPWFKKRKTKFKLLILSLVLGFISAALFLWLRWEMPLKSPISTQTHFRFAPGEWLRKTINPPIIYGFLPYWNLQEANINPKLTHLAYFGLTVGPDGSLETEGDSESLAGYRGLQSENFLNLLEELNQNRTQLELVIKQFSSDDAQKFLRSKEAQNNLFKQLDSLILAYPISGINLDFELVDTEEKNQNQFTEFVKQLSQYLKTRYQKINLSVDVYASAASGKQLWNVAALEPYIDYFIVMAYDFNQRGSPQAGPVSPLIGAGEKHKDNINAYLKEFLEQVPQEKILLGVPFYGYEWQTISRDKTANTYPDSGRTASYQRVQEILDQKKVLNVQENWDDESLVPYISYKKNEETFIIYYENQRSLAYKIDYVNQLDLAGIAIWALGYEGDNLDLWQTIGEKL